jgi:hypothetical protein
MADSGTRTSSREAFVILAKAKINPIDPNKIKILFMLPPCFRPKMKKLDSKVIHRYEEI